MQPFPGETARRRSDSDPGELPGSAPPQQPEQRRRSADNGHQQHLRQSSRYLHTSPFPASHGRVTRSCDPVV